MVMENWNRADRRMIMMEWNFDPQCMGCVMLTITLS